MFSFRSGRVRPGLTGVGIQPEGACVVRVERTAGRTPSASAFEFRAWDTEDSQEKVLLRLCADHDLRHARCTTVLDPGEYALLLTEAPDVPPDELRAAIRWRIKDLIDFHINDATLDVFDVPGEKPAGRARPMYAVAARSAAIQRRVDLLTGAGINLDIIDIPEMAQRNLAALLPEDAKGVVLLSLGAHGGLITITKQAEICLSRSIELGLDTLASGDAPDHLDRIVLEVQRSLDYFDSHFRQAPIQHLALAPLPRELPGLLDYLRTHLNVAVAPMELPRLVQWRSEVPPALQAACLSTLGAALRQEERAL